MKITRTAAASGKAGLPLADRALAWDATYAADNVRKWASSDGSGDPAKIDYAKYSQAFFWKAAGAKTLGDFKLGFADIIDGKLVAVPRGVFAVAAVLQGSRGGVQVPVKEQLRIRNRVSSYYTAMAKQFKDPGIVPPWK